MGPSRSSAKLDALLSAGGETAEAIEAEFHRTLLWKYRNGKSKPDAKSIARMHRVSAGQVPADGWDDLGSDTAEVAS